MADYRFLTVDLATGEVRDELPLESCQWGRVLSGWSPFSASLPVDHPRVSGLNVANVEAARSVVYVERDGIVVGDGIVWDPRKDAGGRGLTIQGAGLASYFARRHLRQLRDYEDVPVDEIAHDLIRWPQGRAEASYGGVGTSDGEVYVYPREVLAGGSLAPSGPGHFRTWPEEERTPTSDALGELADLEDGIDWLVSVETWPGHALAGTLGPFARVADVWWPRRRVESDLVLEWGTNLADYGLAHLGSACANSVEAQGRSDEGPAPIATATYDTAVRPQLDHLIPATDVPGADTLAGLADEYLRTHRTPPVVPTLTVELGRQLRYGDWTLGDVATVRIDDGWAQLDGQYRIVAEQGSVDQDRNETWTLTLEVDQ